MPGLIQPERRIAFKDNDPDSGLIVAARVLPLGQSKEGLNPEDWPAMVFGHPIPFDAWNSWQAGAYIQDALHMLTPGEREFLLTGFTPEAWDALFGTPD